MRFERLARSEPKAMLTLETLQIFIFDFREAAGIRQLQETLRIRSLLFWSGHHSRKPLEEVDGNVVEGHGRRLASPAPQVNTFWRNMALLHSIFLLLYEQFGTASRSWREHSTDTAPRRFAVPLKQSRRQ
jgi:hypothetical protein